MSKENKFDTLSRWQYIALIHSIASGIATLTVDSDDPDYVDAPLDYLKEIAEHLQSANDTLVTVLREVM